MKLYKRYFEKEDWAYDKRNKTNIDAFLKWVKNKSNVTLIKTHEGMRSVWVGSVKVDKYYISGNMDDREYRTSIEVSPGFVLPDEIQDKIKIK